MTDKFIGEILWYYDQSSGGEYGFINHEYLGKIFFHKKNVLLGENIWEYQEKKLVTFSTQISKRSKKLEAVHVRLLENENDAQFLTTQLLNSIDYTKSNIQHNTKSIILFNRLKSSLINIAGEKQQSIFYQFIFVLPKVFETSNHVLLLDILKVLKDLFVNYDRLLDIPRLKKLQFESVLLLWEQDFIKLPTDLIIEKINDIEPLYLTKIINKFSDDELNQFFLGYFFKYENELQEETIYRKLSSVLQLTVENNRKPSEQFLRLFLPQLKIYQTLELWLINIHQELDFNAYKIYVGLLDSHQQQLFVKKVISYIHTGKISLSLEELSSLNVIDYETSKIGEQIDQTALDYSTSIILNTLQELSTTSHLPPGSSQSKKAQQTIYEIILSQLKSPKEILEVKGYFDHCEGRCNANKFFDPDNPNHGKTVQYIRHPENKPKFHFICDGRKALDQKSFTPVLDEKLQIEFWWCANQKCYLPSRRLHHPSEWKNYTLLDFLEILKLDYNEVHFEMYLNVINKVNRFLKHMNCRSCNHILRPVKKTNYAFYGVNLFHCVNKDCNESSQIYISHCSNGFCEEVIDSRDTVRCRPSGHDLHCGWYICKFCNACCTSEGLATRKYIIEKTNQLYRCHLEGHRNQGIICCSKCGSEMTKEVFDQAKYNEVLVWFQNNRDNKKYIAKSGRQKNGKEWFLFKRGTLTMTQFNLKLRSLKKIGFQIPDIEIDKDVQLVAELGKILNPVFTCSNTSCGSVRDLTKDKERFLVMKHFHKQALSNFNIISQDQEKLFF